MKFKKSYNPNVFYSSVSVLVFILFFVLFLPDFSLKYLKMTQEFLTAKFGWFYVLSMTIIFFSVLYLAFSRFGNIKLGPDHSVPEYSNISWFAMLFAAGMGIGLMFFGVSEPLMHFLSPPSGTSDQAVAAKEAMNITFFHWGFSAWACYGIVAVILAFFSYRHNLPLTLRSAFYPLVGDKIYSKFGDIIDVFAVLATLFGVITSLGYGVLQIGGGFEYIFGIESNKTTQIILIFAIMICVTISAVSGVNKGIKILSSINIILAFLLIIFIKLCRISGSLNLVLNNNEIPLVL